MTDHDDSDLIPEADRIEQQTDAFGEAEGDQPDEPVEAGLSADEADVWEQSQTVEDDDDAYDPN